MPRYEVRYLITPGLVGKHDGLPLQQRAEKFITEAPDAETARQEGLKVVKKLLEFWRGSAWLFDPELKIDPVTPPVLPRPWLREPDKTSGSIG